MKKKLFSLLLALVMIVAIAAPVFAADEGCTVTIVYDSGISGGRTYNAYKLMDVTINADETGYNYTPVAKYTDIMVDALNEVLNRDDTPGREKYTAADLVTKVEGLSASQMRQFANVVYMAIKKSDPAIEKDAIWEGETTKLAQGYWLIADVTDYTNSTTHSNSLVMVETINGEKVVINGKAQQITSGKTVDDENDSLIDPNNNSEDGRVWVNVADHDIGDTVHYKIETMLPANVTDYQYYAFLITDSVAQGLTYTESSLVIYINDDNVQRTVAKYEGVPNTTDPFLYEIVTTTNDDGVQTAQTMKIFPNKDYTTVETKEEKKASPENGGDLKALLKSLGYADSQVNSAKITLYYDCVLNEHCELTPTGNPNEYILTFSNNPYGDTRGEIKDKCLVLTYTLNVDKITKDGKALEGADFELYKFVGKYPADTYTEEAHPADLVLHPAANCWGYFEEVKYKTTNATGENEATSFNFIGIDDGYYKLVETKVPDGYKKIDDIEFHVVADHVYDLSTSATVEMTVTPKDVNLASFNVNLERLEISTDVINTSGAELPTTGGIGTTIFYSLGGLLVVAAAVLLITKKRMAVNN